MTDIYDQATEREERDRALAMDYRKPAPIACGVCHNCGEPLRPGMAFCCSDCRDDFQMRAHMREISG
jgi:hypothetical protein